MVRDRLVLGTHLVKAREQIYRDKDIGIENVRKTLKAYEASAKDLKQLYDNSHKHSQVDESEAVARVSTQRNYQKDRFNINNSNICSPTVISVVGHMLKRNVQLMAKSV
jgi:hypothetical protein